ncbi:glycosyl hydrolase [Cryobacterium sp. TMB1-7]|uniref:glycosyl hydrolase n=1 Tax=Cryobacterium sp. TMB1-7 TaxID=2555866 RepID=UPI00141B30E5|nr:glycosyl hydrolase [Cryobacterium sp. TMB1-7]
MTALKKRTWWIVGLGGILAVGFAAVLTVQPWAQVSVETKTLTELPARFKIPAPSAPMALSTSAVASDEFEEWDHTSESDLVQFLANDDAKGGAYSLVVVSAIADPDTAPTRLSQDVAIGAIQTVTVGFWAKATNAAENAVVLALSPDRVSTVLPVPAGTYDWTYVSQEYTTVAGQPDLDLGFSVDGATEGTWIDGLTLTAQDGSNIPISNSEFELNSAELTVVSPSLLLTVGDAHLEVATRRNAEGWVQWAAREGDGPVVAKGSSLLSDFSADADLSELPTGLYTVDFQATLADKVIPRTTTVAVVEKPAETTAAEDATSPFGAFIHYLGGQSRIDNMVDTLASAGIRHVRVEIPWDLVESVPGQYVYPKHVEDTLAAFKDAGIDPLLVPAYYNPNYDKTLTPNTPEGLDAYAKFSRDVVSHYAAVGTDIEVYNEFDHTFNNGRCGRTPECYMEMLVPTVNAVKAANPDAVIASPGNAGMGIKIDWLQEFFEIGGLEYTDVVSAHPYTQPDAPEKLIPQFEQLNQMIKDSNGGVAKPVWLTEMGWASVPNWVTKDQQAQYMVRTMALALGNGVSRVYWFEAASLDLSPGTIETNFGLFDAPSTFLPNSNAPKPAAVAQAVLANKLGSQEFNAKDAVADGSYSYVFGTEKEATRVMWTTDVEASVQISAEKSVTVTDVLGHVQTMKPTAGIVSLQLTGSPVYVTGAVTSVVTE